MNRPNITEHSATTGETVARQMTEDEYAALIESGWTPGDAPNPDSDSDPA